MHSHQRIIDRDIAQYEADAEHHAALLLRCPSGEEHKHRQRANAAANAASALRTYRHSLEG